MIIPGFLIALITFPGVIVHETAHLLFCKLRGVLVFEACFFRVGTPSGYVVHAKSQDFTTTFLISVGPFIVNTILCLLICLPTYLPMRVFGVEHPMSWVLLWLGVSIGMHAFPSTGDAEGLWREAKQKAKEKNLLAMVSLPLVVLIFLANIGRFFWLDYLYGLGVGLGIPSLFFGS